jgi:hypothetical protein
MAPFSVKFSNHDEGATGPSLLGTGEGESNCRGTPTLDKMQHETMATPIP